MILRTQEEFMAARQALWNELDGIVGEGRSLHRLPPHLISRAAALYRAVCGDLMYSRSRGYAPDLVDYLDGLAARTSNALYGPRQGRLPAIWEVLVHDFPVTLRKRWKFFLAAWLLFGIPCAVGVFGALHWNGFAESVLPPGQLAAMANMYAEGFDAGRSEALDSMMAGHYVQNNVGIAFRCFATGILFGLGSIFFLVYNGLVIGTTTGYVIGAGGGPNILTFMCGHGPFELTAIIIAGAAGLQMGYSLIETKGRTRLGSLKAQRHELVALIGGAAVMLLIAAGLEAFWSPSSMPPPVKWGASALFSALIVLYLALGGRYDKERPG